MIEHLINGTFKWESIKERLYEMTKNTDTVFSEKDFE